MSKKLDWVDLYARARWDRLAGAAVVLVLLIIVIVLVVNALSSKLTGASIAKGVDSGTPLGGR